MGVISNGTTLLDAGALDSGVATGAMTLLSTSTASSSANLTFASGINSTYKEYVFKFIDIHPQTNGQHFQVNFRDGSSAYDATKTTTMFYAYHDESGGTPALAFVGSDVLASSTNAARINTGQGSDNDESCAGTLHLYNPSSTTFVKHFHSNIAYTDSSGTPNSINVFVSGYCNVSAAIDGVQFSFNSGNIDSGTIKMYGIK